MKYLLPILFILLCISAGKIVILLESKEMLENELIEHKKAISLYKRFINDVQDYTEAMYKDMSLSYTFESFSEYMSVYATPLQKGSSSKFLAEIKGNLAQEIEVKKHKEHIDEADEALNQADEE